jgi:hypothetical protein
VRRNSFLSKTLKYKKKERKVVANMIVGGFVHPEYQ